MIFIKSFFEKFLQKKNNNLIALIIFFLNAFPHFSLAEISIVNYLVFDELKTCLKKSNFEECRKLILIMEKLQVEAYSSGNFKCQSSLLGMQTELVRYIYFEKYNDFSESIINSNLIKNC